MNLVQLPQFQSRPESSVGVMTLNDAWFLIAQGWLTVEGAQYLFPKESWDFLPQATSKPRLPQVRPRQRVPKAVA
ncbi:hypothetical protein [Altericista sp. CCNU0014]|uniref:hypothetical protein n=1 Tax=Altericista sp. CCNU0014 TaxID=3082949 RepID=UPI0038506133